MTQRPRRLRRNPIIRELVAETRLSRDMFIYPIFLIPGKNIKNPIPSLPGLFHFSTDKILFEIEECLNIGLNKFLLFGTGEPKFEDARWSYHTLSVVQEALKLIKSRFGKDVYLITDVCSCAYTTHGHCGIIKNGDVDNDLTLEVLIKMALSHAHAGADMVAPSDMMDGRVGAIREALDKERFEDISIMSYSIKFASAYYGPFRDAAGSSPEFGDRKTYQMDFRNSREAMKEADLDEEQGADILMVKPAMAYLDIIKDLSNSTLLPVAAYNVSGEYAMVKLSAQLGLVEEKNLVMENMYALARAGASIIISYHSKDILEKNWINL